MSFSWFRFGFISHCPVKLDLYCNLFSQIHSIDLSITLSCQFQAFIPEKFSVFTGIWVLKDAAVRYCTWCQHGRRITYNCSVYYWPIWGKTLIALALQSHVGTRLCCVWYLMQTLKCSHQILFALNLVWQENHTLITFTLLTCLPIALKPSAYLPLIPKIHYYHRVEQIQISRNAAMRRRSPWMKHDRKIRNDWNSYYYLSTYSK